MDFLEGFLLGPNWSDTFYQEKNHRGISLFSFAFFAFLLGRMMKNAVYYSSVFQIICGILLIVLLFVSPYISSIYYKISLPWRFLFLLLQFIKKIIPLVLVAGSLISLFNISSNINLYKIFSIISDLFGDFVTFMSRYFHILGIIIVTFICVILAIILFILMIALIYFLPKLIIYIMDILQNFIDKIYMRLFRKYII